MMLDDLWNSCGSFVNILAMCLKSILLVLDPLFGISYSWIGMMLFSCKSWMILRSPLIYFLAVAAPSWNSVLIFRIEQLHHVCFAELSLQHLKKVFWLYDQSLSFFLCLICLLDVGSLKFAHIYLAIGL